VDAKVCLKEVHELVLNKVNMQYVVGGKNLKEILGPALKRFRQDICLKLRLFVA
jgi:hypothetical protein